MLEKCNRTTTISNRIQIQCFIFSFFFNPVDQLMPLANAQPKRCPPSLGEFGLVFTLRGSSITINTRKDWRDSVKLHTTYCVLYRQRLGGGCPSAGTLLDIYSYWCTRGITMVGSHLVDALSVNTAQLYYYSSSLHLQISNLIYSQYTYSCRIAILILFTSLSSNY